MSGSVPASIVNLTGLTFLYLDYNRLSMTTDPTVEAFLDIHDPTWDETQTLPPENLATGWITRDSVETSFTPIVFTGGGGYYEVGYSETPGGPYTSGCTTPDKSTGGCVVRGLMPETTYYFVTRTNTADDQRVHELWSLYGGELEVTTTANTFCDLVTQIPETECEALLTLYDRNDQVAGYRVMTGHANLESGASQPVEIDAISAVNDGPLTCHLYAEAHRQ